MNITQQRWFPVGKLQFLFLISAPLLSRVIDKEEDQR